MTTKLKTRTIRKLEKIDGQETSLIRATLMAVP